MTTQQPNPIPVDNPDFSEVIEMCKQYIYDLQYNFQEDSDSEAYITEAALTAVFGDNIYKWINNQIDQIESMQVIVINSRGDNDPLLRPQRDNDILRG